MLAILTTHPIQYQVPLWQALARDGRVPFQVWYLTEHAAKVSRDREFGKSFAWDLDMLSGYPHRFLDVVAGATPNTFWKCRLRESLPGRLRASGATALWVQGWQVAAYWQAVWAAKGAGVEVWLRAESNDLAPIRPLKRAVKRVLLGQFFRRVDRFLCIGSGNRRLYERYGVRQERLHPAPYAVDNERFARQAEQIRNQKAEIRNTWNIAQDAFCVLFCGKFVPKKRPLDLVEAARLLKRDGRLPNIHLLFVGSGELGANLRDSCHVVFDAECSDPPGLPRISKLASPSSSFCPPRSHFPSASFAGFLNQTEISKAYVAAECLVLPSDFGETWGLVVNEAMASGLPCTVSDHCGCAEDLGARKSNEVFGCGDFVALAESLLRLAERHNFQPLVAGRRTLPCLGQTVETVVLLSKDMGNGMRKISE